MTGHLYQGRFKAFPIAADDHFLTVCRHVERNALRANRVEHAEQWRWGSLWRRQQEDAEPRKKLSPWPVAEPRHWVEFVNQPQTAAEMEKVRQRIQRGRPYGNDAWTAKTTVRLGLETTLRPRGRPRKTGEEGNKGSCHLC